MNKPAPIPGSAKLEMHNIPTELILYAVQNWQACQPNQAKRSGGYNTNPVLKGIEAWLILKSQTTSGRLHNYRSQLQQLAALCKVKVRTMDNRVAWLRKEGLVMVQGQDLVMNDFKILRKYHIDIREREETFYYDTESKTTLADILVAIAMQRFKDRWRKMYWKKMNQNPNALAEVRNHLIAFGADQERLDDQEYFRECHLNLLVDTYKSEESGQSSFYLLHEFIEANPDINCRQDTYAFKLGYSAATSFCNLKFRLISKGLLRVRKEHVRSEYRARKDEETFHHRWLKKAKQTIWFRVDQVSVNLAYIYAKKMAAKA